MDHGQLGRQLIRELALLKSASADELCRLLGISQPAFSRLVKQLGPRLLIAGRARATRYAARRTLLDLGERLPVYEIDEGANAAQVATLHAVLPTGFYVEALSPTIASGFHDDLPYWLNELRPSGFLGRLVPRQHPELELPSEVRLWTADQTLRYLALHGWNLSGSLIVGDAAFQHYVSLTGSPAGLVSLRQRRTRYPVLSREILEQGMPGSSAGGEQPKFLATIAEPRRAVLVKFSPPDKSNVAQRIADLLVAEHLALEVLAKHHQPASKSELVVSGEQVFLEVERFDRLATGGRRGLLSLWALDSQFLGRLVSWPDSVSRLAELGVVPRALVTRAAWLSLFGQLIANTDMHPGNLSFIARGAQVSGLAPSYDMLPAQYAGRQGHLAAVTFKPPTPSPADAAIWKEASAAALELWQLVAAHPLVSAEFRRIAMQNAQAVEAYRRTALLLPVAGDRAR